MPTTGYRSIEFAVDLIETRIRADIATALAAVRTLKNDNSLTTEPPKEYFIYEEAHTYRAPGVFLIPEDVDVRDNQMQSNHLNSMTTMICAVVVEDREKRLVTRKAWRYQAALMQVLHRTTLTTSDETLKIFIRVQKCQFSGLVAVKTETDGTVFRKEMSLRLQIDCVENLEGV